MTSASATLPDNAAVDYCRRARRLRGRLAGDPSRLHRALRQLNETPAVPSPTGRSAPATIKTPIPVTVCPAALLGVRPDQEVAVRRFVIHVRNSLAVEPIMSHDHRAKLLRTANRLGIERFHANLVIAALLHEVAVPAPVVVRASRSTLWAVLATQAAIIISAIIAWN